MKYFKALNAFMVIAGAIVVYGASYDILQPQSCIANQQEISVKTQRVILRSSNGDIMSVWTSRGNVIRKGDEYVFLDNESGKRVNIDLKTGGGVVLVIVDL